MSQKQLCDCNQGRLPCTCKPDAHHLQRTAADERVDVLEGLLFSLPEDLKALSSCENTSGVYACIDYIEQCIAGLQLVTAKGVLTGLKP